MLNIVVITKPGTTKQAKALFDEVKPLCGNGVVEIISTRDRGSITIAKTMGDKFDCPYNVFNTPIIDAGVIEHFVDKSCNILVIITNTSAKEIIGVLTENLRVRSPVDISAVENPGDGVYWYPASGAITNVPARI